MTATVTSEQLYCANCSDPVDEIDEQNLGRCCRNLPHPWHRGSDGLYTESSYSDDAEAEDEDPDGDEDDDERPSCPYCGASDFTVRAVEWRQVTMSQTVSGLNEEYNDRILWYDRADFDDDETLDTDRFETSQVVCAHCHNDVTLDLELEEL
jgi:hypothetical protein